MGKPSKPAHSGPTPQQQAELAELIRAAKERRAESLPLFEPMEKQEQFLASKATTRILRGGNRCLSGDTEIWDPVAGRLRRLDETDEPFHVLALNKSGELVTAACSEPFVKGYGDLYEVMLSNGGSFKATLEHRILAADGQWVSVADAAQHSLPLLSPRQHESAASHPRSTSGIARQASLPGGRRWSQTTQGWTGRYFACCRPCGERLLRDVEVSQVAVTSQVDAPGCIRCGSLRGGRVDAPRHSRPCRSTARLPSRGASRLQDSQRAASGTCAACKLSRPASDSPPAWLRFRLHSARPSRTTPALPLPATGLFSEAGSLQLFSDGSESTLEQGQAGLRPSRHSGRIDRGQSPHEQHQRPFSPPLVDHTLIITSLRKKGKGYIWDITVPGYENYWLAGGISHNSGKTATGAVETARCALGCDPYKKYRPGPQIIWVIGKGEDHVGRVLFEKLFSTGPQSFKVIKDLETGEWRSYRPWLPDDLKRESETRFASPLIPGRMIEKKGIAWKNRKINLPSLVRLKNGTIIYFFTSGGDAPMGSAVDLIWIDEDIENPGWVPEMRMRLPDRKGRMIWTAWPWSSNDALVDLSKQAESQATWEKPTVQEWVISFSGNKHLDPAAKAEVLVDLEFRGESEVASRDRGEFGFGDAMVFPYFHIDTHGLSADKLPAKQVPPSWTRFLCVDPGHSEAAALFVAIAPPDDKEFGGMALVYDEVYQTKASASTMAEAIEKKARGQQFQAFLIDNHGSRKTEEGSGRTIRWQYQKEFERLKLHSEMTGSDFFPGTDDIPGRISAVREAMRITDPAKGPKFRVLKGATPRLLWELERYRFTRDQKTGLISEKPNDKGIHVTICAQYLFAWPGLRYHKPKPKPGKTAMDFFQKMKRKRRMAEDNVIPLY